MGTGNVMEVQIRGDGSDLNQTIDDVLGGLGEMRAAVAAAGGALAALGAGSLALATSAAADFEEAMVGVEKVTDPSTARRMSGAIREMAETIPLAQSELAGLAADAARFGIRGEENIRAFTESVARMATATDLSAQEAGEAFARLAQLTGTPVGEVENLGSAINELSNNFATSSSEITDSMLRSSAALSQFGLSQTEIVALSAALNEVSESSERAGTRLRRVAQELTDSEEEVAAALGMSVSTFEQLRREEPARLFVEMAEAMREGGAEADALRSTLSTASRQAIAGLGQNLEGLNDGLTMSASSYEEATSLQEEFNAATDTFNAQLTLTKNSLRNVAIETGDNLLPALTGVLGVVNEGIGAFQRLNTATNGAAGTLAGFGATAAGVGMVLSAFGVAAGGPVALAILGIGALATAYSQNWLDIRTIVDTSAGEIVEQLGRIDDALVENETSIESNKSTWEEWGEFLSTDIANKLDMLATGLTQLITGIIGAERATRTLMTKQDPQRAKEIIDNTIEEMASQGEAHDMRQFNRENPVEDTTGIATSVTSSLEGVSVGLSGTGLEMPQPDTEGTSTLVETLRGQNERLRELLRAQQANTEAVKGSMLSQGPCDLREQLLTPFERAPQPRARRRPLSGEEIDRARERDREIVQTLKDIRAEQRKRQQPEIHMDGRKVTDVVQHEQVARRYKEVVHE